MGPLALSFAAPAALFGLLLLPGIYLLLRVTPPRPHEIVFPPIRLLFDLLRREETPARTPWWLLLLRLAVAACAILAMAGPTFAPTAATPFSRAPLLITIDDGWPAAPTFDKRIEAARALATEAARAGAPVALLAMSEADAEPALDDGGKIDERLRALAPRPFLPDRAAAAARVASFVAAHPGARIVWIADGLEQGRARDFAEALRKAAGAGAETRILADAHVPRALVAPSNRAGGLEVEVIRAAAEAPPSGRVSAFDAQGRVVAEAPFAFEAAGKATARFALPIELRNEVALLRLEGEPSTGAVALLDGRAKVRRVAVLSGTSADLAQPLLAPQYYLAKAFAPFAEVREPRPGVAEPLLGLLAERPDMVALADVGVVPGEELDALTRFVEEGGVLLRFAGPRLANNADELTPVRLRRNGRVLGGAMSWETPKKLAPFDAASPFFGLLAPEEVTVTRQVLAEPEPGLPAKTWAALTDGTPLVTAERRGKGLVVLFHVSADATWSDLPISGLFVEMLRRIAAESGESAARREGEAKSDAPALAPLATLDGRGIMRAPPPTARPIPGDFDGSADRDHPPGFYGPAEAPLAVQPLRPGDELRRLDFAALGLGAQGLAGDGPIDLRPLLLTLAFLGFLADWAILLAISGGFRRPALAAMAICALALLGAPREAEAKDPPKHGSGAAALSQRDRDAALTARLAFVLSGDRGVDETSRLGLEALSTALSQRTSFAPGPPVGVDPGRDELAFYSMLYWPIVASAPLPSPQAIAKVGVYLRQGGTIVFDTRDALVSHPGGAPSPETKWLRELTRNLDIPELEVVPRDHVITKTFYLLDGFYGRTINGKTWVEALPPERKDDPARPVRATDSVSSVVITSNDLAGAWAVGTDGRPLYTLTPGGARQRELALRGGVNLVMYTLTGNYKSDQVHVRDLLERLGQ
jgi:hypothetical protein